MTLPSQTTRNHHWRKKQRNDLIPAIINMIGCIAFVAWAFAEFLKECA